MLQPAVVSYIADAFMKRTRQAENKTEPAAGYHLAAVLGDIEAVGEALRQAFPELDLAEFYSRSGYDRKSRIGGGDNATQSEA